MSGYSQKWDISCIAPGFIEIAKAKDSEYDKRTRNVVINVRNIVSIDEFMDGFTRVTLSSVDKDGSQYYVVDCGIGAFRTSLIIAMGGIAKRKDDYE